jgi:U-box domain/Tir chaperone protein (CesT) family
MRLEIDRRKRARLSQVEPNRNQTVDERSSSPIPRGFMCPLTMEVMFQPVLDGEGNTYERAALFKWLEQNPTSPISRQPLNQRMVLSNNALRETIHEFMGSAWVQQKTAELDNAQAHGVVVAAADADVDAAASNNDNLSGKAPSRLRSKIDCFLQHTCHELGGLDLKLNEDGCCAFRYDTITIVLDVPEQIGVFCLYTKDLLEDASSLDHDRLYRRAMELNFLQGDTRGGCLSVRSHSSHKEIMFSYTDRVPEVSARDFSNILLNFVETAVSLREKLLQGMPTAAPTPTPPPSAAAPEWWEDEADDEAVDVGEVDEKINIEEQH